MIYIADSIDSNDFKSVIVEWANNHLSEYKDGLSEGLVIQHIKSFDSKMQSLCINRLFSESIDRDNTKLLFKQIGDLDLKNPSFDNLKFFLDGIVSRAASREGLTQGMIFDSYMQLLFKTNGAPELEYFTPGCIYDDLPDNFGVNLDYEKGVIVGSHEGTTIYKGYFGHTQNKKFALTGSYSILKPKFCEGRIYKNKTNGVYIPFSKVLPVPFYWCYNHRCIVPSIVFAENVNHEATYKSNVSKITVRKYALITILKQLGILTNEDNVSFHLCASFNSAEKFFHHLKCRKCGVYLTAKDRSDYAYYQIKDFVCKKCGLEVHLTHCLNGDCHNMVDSRDSVQCSNSWYICNQCLGCCDERNISLRSQNRKERGKKPLIQIGHCGKHLFCPKCGKRIDNGDENEDDSISKALIFFIRHGNDFVLNSGLNRYNNHWFVIDFYKLAVILNGDNKENDLVSRLTQIGLEVTKTTVYSEINHTYYVSEPIKDRFVKNIKLGDKIECKCGFTVEVNYSIRKFHNPKIRDIQRDFFP